jgi:hypothetical protein
MMIALTFETRTLGFAFSADKESSQVPEGSELHAV